VRDSAALLDAVEGAAVGDPFVISSPDRPFLEALQRPPEPLRIAFTTTHFWSGDPVELSVARAAEDAARLCAEMGHDVQEAAPAIDAETLVAAMFVMWCVATAAWVEQTAAATGRRPGPDTLEGLTLAWYERGRDVRATEFCAALETLGAIGRDVAAFFDRYDVLITPTMPTLPPPIGVYDPHAPVTAEWYYESELGQLESFTSIFNCSGQPAISLPLYESAEGLPIGVQLAGRWGEESALLRLGAALEEQLPWRERIPRISAAT
jgi:amidase